MSGAMLDVSDLLTDPDFVQIVGLIRLTQVVGTNGRATNTPTNSNFIGSVTPSSARQLELLPPTARTGGEITVITKMHLIEATATNAADIVTWRGNKYTVMKILDWSQFGAGFMAAICTLKDLTGPNS